MTAPRTGIPPAIWNHYFHPSLGMLDATAMAADLVALYEALKLTIAGHCPTAWDGQVGTRGVFCAPCTGHLGLLRHLEHLSPSASLVRPMGVSEVEP